MPKARKGSRNPIAFTPYPVTVFSLLVYLAVLIPLLVIHLVVPPAPGNDTPINGIKISEAFQDLTFLSNGFHPYNSQRNDVIRNWLLLRIEEILVETNASQASVSNANFEGASGDSPSVVVFNDLDSNLTFSGAATGQPVTSTYFEGTNIITYVRGTEDPDGDWWLSGEDPDLGGVLVNAHYDSVSTGYGATDDGVGVVTLLQLLRFFSTSGNQPRRGVILLFNNGEEDWLNGARAFARHPISRFPHSFLNLEGAGAGGRATLFRSTDAEVTSFYRGTSHPFGSAVSSDGFKRGLIRSGTDYSVFYDALGMRGLDVAFMEPRARYHTEQDDFRHTSRDSIWHMLSAAVHTTKGLAANTERTFEGDASARGKVPSGTGSDAVWFDLFGRSFVVFELHTLFAVSVTLLVVAPITLIVVGIVLSKTDKLYLFSMSAKLYHADGHESVRLKGFRGFFRFPIVLVVASVIVFGLAFLVAKVNPYIIYSSPYSSWSMMLSVWIFAAWFLSRVADFIRPTAFHRSFAMVWLFVLGWVVLVIATVYEEKLKIASGYYVVFNFCLISLATLIAFLEQFTLETRCDFAESMHEENADSRHRQSSVPRSNASRERSASQEPRAEEEDGEEEATESTSLLRQGRATFANYTSDERTEEGPANDEEAVHVEDPRATKVYEHEQLWSYSLPTWTWLLQFLLLAVIPVIIAGQLGLLLTSAAHQVAADGSPVLMPYLVVAFCSILILVPLSPFIHRLTYHIPLFLLAVFVGTVIYNLVAFPFSDNSRLKLYFVQRVNLDTGANEVAINGMDSLYIDKVIASLPSAAGQTVSVSASRRTDLVEHTFAGLSPLVVPNTREGIPPSTGYADWLHVNATRTLHKNEARISLFGRNTRSCRLFFAPPVADFRVDGSDADARFPGIPDEGVSEIRLWSRDWERGWTVTVRWTGDGGLDGQAVCLWNDEGTGGIPALQEIRRFAPDWAAVTKLDDGLVEGSKVFLV